MVSLASGHQSSKDDSDKNEFSPLSHSFSCKISRDQTTEQRKPILYEVVHKMPGRIRLKMPDLKYEPRLSVTIINQLSSKSYVISVKTNYWNGSVVVQYDQSSSGYTDIVNLLDQLQWPSALEIELKPIVATHVLRQLSLLIESAIPPLIQVIIGVTAFVSIPLGLSKSLARLLLIASVVPISSRALRTLLDEKKLGVDALDGMAATLMIANGKMVEAGFMTALIALGEYIRERTARRCEKIVSDLLGLAGRSAWLVKGKKRICVPADEIKIGDIVVVYPGDMVPVDGIVISGEAEIDQSKLTGESAPVVVTNQSFVYASTVAVEGKIHVRCQAAGTQTKAGLVLETITQAPLHETKIQNYAAVIADRLIVPIFIGAAACFLYTRNIARMMSMLIFDFSTGIRIAAPTAVLSSMHQAGRRGILIKSGGALERLANVNAIVFDKTGTLTHGEPKVLDVIAINGHGTNKILSLAAAAEARLHHPASRAIAKHAAAKGLSIPDRATSTFKRGLGVKAEIDGSTITIGSKRMMEAEGIETDIIHSLELELGKRGESLAYIAINNELAGIIPYRDQCRPELAKTISQLKKLGISKLVMATGDGDAAAQLVAKSCGINEVMSRLFPEQKANLVKELKEQGYVVAVIGDGINDSPALAHADVAISLHGGTAAAKHSADVVLTDDDLERLPEAIKIARSAMDLINQNLSLAVIPNSIGLVLAATGMVGPAEATLLNNGSAIAAAINSLRPLYSKNLKI